MFGEDGLLHGYPGEEEVESPVFTWTYDVFGEDITPSMYEIMAEYVSDNITKDQLYEIQGGDYYPGDLEDDAVDAYYDLPTLEKIKMHKKTLKDLKELKDMAENKLKHACVFGIEETNPIAQEVNEFVQNLIEKTRERVEYFKEEIEREEEWRGGFEEGASDDV